LKRPAFAAGLSAAGERVEHHDARIGGQIKLLPLLEHRAGEAGDRIGDAHHHRPGVGSNI
jgi:hypothetical protein